MCAVPSPIPASLWGMFVEPVVDMGMLSVVWVYPCVWPVSCTDEPSHLVVEGSPTVRMSQYQSPLFWGVANRLSGPSHRWHTPVLHHATLVNKLPPRAGLIIGVMNPFFEKSCSHWSHILSLGKWKSCVYASYPALRLTWCRFARAPNPKTAGPNTRSNGASAGSTPGRKTV